ncbi:DUF4362 domain-containing protein [Lysinibacillus sp. NPDC096418]|uniref:DUF4362 domain-containing protein n=1 Tax=Lysinibacillus sp. NPDC096418 TaxID=3364138 RepID=UPI0038076057
MKKINGLFILFFILLIYGCNSVDSSTDIYMFPNNIPPYYISSLEDIVETHGELENKTRFDEFINHVYQGKEDHIRVVRYTTEGDPILHDLEYDGKIVKSITDTRRDQYVQGSIIQTTCTSIEEVETNESTEYILKDCERNGDKNILSIKK